MNTYSFFVLISLIFDIGVVISDEIDKQAKLRFYYGTFDNYTELPLHAAQEIFTKNWYNSSRETVIFAHGFSGIPRGPAVTAVITAYLEQVRSNVMLLNWSFLAADPASTLVDSYLNWAVPNAKKLGVRFGEILLKIARKGFDLNRTHLVGHSLGAHLMGTVGNHVLTKGVQIYRITGLDPTHSGTKPPEARLNSGSAKFVSVIHSDPSKFGCRKAVGMVDFWPNYRIGTVKQPGCDKILAIFFSSEDLCSHNRSWELLVEALRRPGSVVGSYAKSYGIWKSYKKEERNAIVLDIAEYHPNIKPGNYFFVTNSHPPYGLGRDGL